jgi:hypothetical protein
MPKNFEPVDGSDHVLRMRQNLYGSAYASKLWFEKATEGLRERGYVPSRIDPCLFVSETMVICCYIDDLAIWYTNESDFDALIDSFKQDGDEYNWELTVEGSLQEYLGIEMKTLPDGSVQLTQRGLIQRILEMTGMTDCNDKRHLRMDRANHLDRTNMDPKHTERGITPVWLDHCSTWPQTADVISHMRLTWQLGTHTILEHPMKRQSFESVDT